MATFRYIADVSGTDLMGEYTLSVSECSECGALVAASGEGAHGASHLPSLNGPVIEFRWVNDDLAFINVNGHHVATYNYDNHGRDGLAQAQEVAEGIARVLGGTFESEN